jgi:enterochelin esterase family protein
VPAPKLLDDHVRFRLADPAGELASVSLDCSPAVPGPRQFARSGDVWELRLPVPDLQRLEYRLEVTRHDGGHSVVLDPDNPKRVPTVFGERSVVEMPGYAAPAWLRGPAVEGGFSTLEVRGETASGVPVTVWSPEGATPADPLPLLVVHDGPEYDVYASITRYSAAHVAAGVLPAHRVALAQPVDRDAWYSASPRYLRTLVHDGLAQLTGAFATTGPVVVMGASLGGLTAVLAGLLGAPTVGGVFAQSGSFFQVRHDDDESGFRYFGRISRTVASVLDARHTDHALHVAMTCGGLEGNASNNADMATALRRAGHDVTYATVPDLHNYTAWRDSLDPALTDVLRKCWGAQG